MKIIRYLFYFVFIIGLLMATFDALTQAQTYVPLPTAKPQFFDSNGDPLNGGKLYTCEVGAACPGTTEETYSDYQGLTTNANPVVLDSAGRANIFYKAGTAYKLELQTSASSTIWEVDGVRFAAVDTVSGTSNQVTVTGTSAVVLSLAGPHNFNSQITNGVLYGRGTSSIAATDQGAANTVLASSGGVPAFTGTPTVGRLYLTSTTYNSIPTSSNGSLFFCSDCTAASNPCNGGGNGALLIFLNGARDCR